MEKLIERAAGLDVHQATVVACVVIEQDGARLKRETRTFETVRRGLEQLREWLGAMSITHVAMEGTGVYWMPVYAVLEDYFDIALVNARHVIPAICVMPLRPQVIPPKDDETSDQIIPVEAGLQANPRLATIHQLTRILPDNLAALVALVDGYRGHQARPIV